LAAPPTRAGLSGLAQEALYAVHDRLANETPIALLNMTIHSMTNHLTPNGAIKRREF